MRKVQLISALALLALFSACKQNAKQVEDGNAVNEIEAAFDTSKYKALDLGDYNIEKELYVKSSNDGNESVKQSASGSVEFNLNKDYRIEIVPNPLSIDMKKEELETDPLYSIKYVEETKDYIFYSKEIENSGIDPEFHFYLIFEDKDGAVAVKTQNMLQLNQEEAEAILKDFKKQQNIQA